MILVQGVSPKCRKVCPSKREEAEGGSHRRAGAVTMEAEIGVMKP